MDCSYIEDESIHIMVPYLSEPRWSLNLTTENLDEGEHQVSRPFESNNLSDCRILHHYLPDWQMGQNSRISRPNTLIVSIPVKKHLLDDSSFIEEEDNDNNAISNIYDAYGRSGLYLSSKFKWEPPLEKKVIDEFTADPYKTVNALKGCKEFVRCEVNMLNKIIVDFCVEYYRKWDKKELSEWVRIAKEFYLLVERPIETNFDQAGILHLATREEYFKYFERLENMG